MADTSHYQDASDSTQSVCEAFTIGFMLQPKVQELTQAIEVSRQRMTELERLWREERRRFQDLVSQLLPLLHSADLDPPEVTQVNTKDVPNVGNPPEPKKRLTRFGTVDRRTMFNPEKSMKISVIRTLEWARQHNKNEEDTLWRVQEVLTERAKHYGFDKIPKSVRAYIDWAVREHQ